MAYKKMGSFDLSAATDTIVYTVPASKTANVTVSLCNRTTVPTAVRLAIVDPAGTVASKDYLNYDLNLVGNTTFERNNIQIHADVDVVVRTSNTGVSCVIYGDEI